MAISDRSFDTRLSYGNKISPLVILIAIAMTVFVVLAFFRALTTIKLPENGDVTGYFEEHVLSWFALSNNNDKILTRPWTILTYSFTHTNLWQLFASMIWLWGFGYILMDLTGVKKIIPIFIYGTLGGALAYIVANNFIPSATVTHNYLLGSGAAVLALCTAATTICPNYKIFPMLGGGISLWILSIIYVAIDMATLPPNNPVLYISHLAGGVTGFLFIFILRKGIDGSDWMNNLYDKAMNLFVPDDNYAKQRTIKSTLFYKTSKTPFTKTQKLTQQRLDEILDKINQYGYEKLSNDEKEFLKRASREDLKGR